MPTAAGAALATLPQQILNTGMGLLLEGHNDRRARKNARKMQAIQIEGQKEMGKFNYQQQMALWHDTNYGAQMEELKKAGLNPGLIYEGGGQGGTTATQPGSVAPYGGPQGGMEIMNMMMTKAQMELIKAQTEKTKAETGIVPLQGKNIEASTGNLLQGISSAKAQQELTEIQSGIASVTEEVAKATQNAQKAIIFTELRQATERLQLLENEREISTATVNTKINQIKQELALAYLEGVIKKYEATNIDQATRESINRVKLSIQQNMREWDKLGRPYIDHVLTNDETEGLPKEVSEILTILGITTILKGKKPTTITGFQKK